MSNFDAASHREILPSSWEKIHRFFLLSSSELVSFSIPIPKAKIPFYFLSFSFFFLKIEKQNQLVIR
ncbi:hypothetical protein RIF29_40354 [Crotalaria pallida]|uniref:Uncharacterized protein n=1 Tax=Crotalaria pallida TaxID=3830 RepID=A0AAN9HU93_CROPI